MNISGNFDVCPTGTLAELERLRERLAAIHAVVDAQAEDEGLWGVPVFGTQPITEAYLQQELRRLHRVVEDGTAEST